MTTNNTCDKSNADSKTKNFYKMLKIENIVAILSVFMTVYTIANTVYIFNYRVKCEEFYHIPMKYFTTDIVRMLIGIFALILILIFSVMPLILRKVLSEQQLGVINNMGYLTIWAVVFGMIIGIINVYNLCEVMEHLYEINKVSNYISMWMIEYPECAIVIMIALSMFLLLGILIFDKVKMLKKKVVKVVFITIFCISYLVSALLMIFGTIFRWTVSLDEKTNYEMVEIEEVEYIVISEYKDKVLIVPFEINEKNQYVLKTSSYMFKEITEGHYKYIDMNTGPQIEFE